MVGEVTKLRTLICSKGWEMLCENFQDRRSLPCLLFLSDRAYGFAQVTALTIPYLLKRQRSSDVEVQCTDLPVRFAFHIVNAAEVVLAQPIPETHLLLQNEWVLVGRDSDELRAFRLEDGLKLVGRRVVADELQDRLVLVKWTQCNLKSLLPMTL